MKNNRIYKNKTKNNKTKKTGGIQVTKKNYKKKTNTNTSTSTRNHRIKAKTILNKLSQNIKSSVKTEKKANSATN